MMHKIRFLAIVMATSILSGCAFTVHETPVGYVYTTPSELNRAPAGINIVVKDVRDERTVSDPRIISHLVNGHGQTTTGGFAAEKPVSEIVKEGIEQALKTAGYSPSETEIDLNANLIDYTYDAVSGAWSINKVTAKMEMSVELLMGNEKFLKNTVIGKHEMLKDEIKGKNNKELITELFSKTLDDTISQLVEVVNIAARNRY